MWCSSLSHHVCVQWAYITEKSALFPTSSTGRQEWEVLFLTIYFRLQTHPTYRRGLCKPFSNKLKCDLGKVRQVIHLLQTVLPLFRGGSGISSAVGCEWFTTLMRTLCILLHFLNPITQLWILANWILLCNCWAAVAVGGMHVNLQNSKFMKSRHHPNLFALRVSVHLFK